MSNPAPTGTLSRIFIEHEGYVSDKWEHYISVYEAALARFVVSGQPVSLLEIGVQNGGSLQVWSKYLPQGSTIVGIDIDPVCAELTFGPDVSVRIGDATDPAALDQMIADACFDIIIDDGSHRSEQTISTFAGCFGRLKPGGLYIIEDLHASYFASHGGGFRLPGTSMEWLKGLIDALNADHFEDDAARKIDHAELQRLQDLGRQIAYISFFDSLAVIEKLDEEKREPYRRTITGQDATVADAAGQIIPLLPDSQLRTLLLPSTTASSFAPVMLNAIATAREEVGSMRALLTQTQAQHEADRRAASERMAQTEARAVQAENNVVEEIRRRTETEGNLAAEVRRRTETEGNLAAEVRRRTETDRNFAAEVRRRTETDRNFAAEVRRRTEAEGNLAAEIRRRTETDARAAADVTALENLQAEVNRLQAEGESLRRERDLMLSSTFWRMTGPARRAAAMLPPKLRRHMRRGAKTVYWILTPHRMGERITYLRSRGTAAPTPPQTASPPPQQPEARSESVPTVDQLLGNRFPALEPLRTYQAPHHGPRVTIVTDSINTGSLYGGVATAIILGALLTRRLGGELRLVARMEPPDAGNIGMILRTHDVPWSDNVECLYSPPGREGRDVPLSRDDLFLTTSWWTTRATRAAVPSAQIIYMLGEDERLFYPAGDDYLLSGETLSDPGILYAVNSKLLFEHLQSNGMAPNGVAFEPAFPATAYYPEERAQTNERRQFFFYARPPNVRNLYWRGLSAIAAAIEEGVFDPEKWDFSFVGKGIPEVVLPQGVRPRIMNDATREEYMALVRRVDVGLSLIYTPHPSYPPFDLAASGAVVVTNRFGSKADLRRYSPNILCVEPSISSLVAALGRAATLAEDRVARAAGLRQFSMPRDWATALAPILDHVVKQYRRE